MQDETIGDTSAGQISRLPLTCFDEGAPGSPCMDLIRKLVQKSLESKEDMESKSKKVTGEEEVVPIACRCLMCWWKRMRRTG